MTLRWSYRTKDNWSQKDISLSDGGSRLQKALLFKMLCLTNMLDKMTV